MCPPIPPSPAPNHQDTSCPPPPRPPTPGAATARTPPGTRRARAGRAGRGLRRHRHQPALPMREVLNPPTA
ncbi:hypothetical protein Ddc_23112 [Ditylenchus destructor]|nr:hypothetical protein Ddc_23112 [Ditylenchus destructor]